MPRNLNTRERIEQFLANTACKANVLSAVHGVPMADVAGDLRLAVESGPSPFALRAGVSFEKAIFADDAERLREQLVRVGLLAPGSSGLLDLRLRQQGGQSRGLDDACQRFARFVDALAASPNEGPSLVAGPAIRLPADAVFGDGLLAIDVLVVDRRVEGEASLVVGEIKSYADRGGHTDRAALAAARAQAGLYLHVVRRALGDRGLEGRVKVANEGFLVLRHVSSNFPKVRYPEDLRWQALRADRALARIGEALSYPMPQGDDQGGARRRLEVVRNAPKAFSEGCLRFCELAKHCHGCALEKGDPVVLGDDVARLLQGLDLGRVEALLDGAVPANDLEADIARKLNHGGR